jgi:hypothetical protein
MITENKIHYAKSSIRNYQGETPRLQVNMDVVGTTNNKIHKLQWKMTQERRELWNGLTDAEDDGWSTYTQAEELWRDLRKEHGHSIKLWLGKLHERARFVPGKVQTNTRIPYAVSLLVLHRQTQQLIQYVFWDDWHSIQEFHDIEGADYNRIWDFRNPLSTKANTPATKRIEL